MSEKEELTGAITPHRARIGIGRDSGNVFLTFDKIGQTPVSIALSPQAAALLQDQLEEVLGKPESGPGRLRRRPDRLS